MRSYMSGCVSLRLLEALVRLVTVLRVDPGLHPLVEVVVGGRVCGGWALACAGARCCRL